MTLRAPSFIVMVRRPLAICILFVILLAVLLLTGCNDSAHNATPFPIGQAGPPLPPGAEVLQRTGAMPAVVLLPAYGPITNLLSAYFEPSAIIGLLAFIDVKTNITSTNWVRILTVPYPMTGGRITATNIIVLGQVCQFRSGYTFPK